MLQPDGAAQRYLSAHCIGIRLQNLLLPISDPAASWANIAEPNAERVLGLSQIPVRSSTFPDPFTTTRPTSRGVFLALCAALRPVSATDTSRQDQVVELAVPRCLVGNRSLLIHPRQCEGERASGGPLHCRAVNCHSVETSVTSSTDAPHAHTHTHTLAWTNTKSSPHALTGML